MKKNEDKLEKLKCLKNVVRKPICDRDEEMDEQEWREWVGWAKKKKELTFILLYIYIHHIFNLNFHRIENGV